MEACLINECPPFANRDSSITEWSFLERYPELSFYFKKDPAVGARIEAHYRRVQAYVQRYIAPVALEIDLKMMRDPNYVPMDLLEAACDYKLFSMMFPSVFGGSGEHIVAAFITYELIASHCVGLSNLIGVNGLAIGCILSTFDPRSLSIMINLITENEKKRIPTLLSTCVTEPGAGSDAEDADEFEKAVLKTTATRVKGGYELNGTKIFISNGSLAQLHVVIAYDAAGKHRPEDLLVFLVPNTTPGVSTPRNEKKMGQRVCPATEVVFENAFVPDAYVCRQGAGKGEYAYTGIANVLGLTRAGVGAFATGVAENAYRTALKFVHRHDFLGQPMEQQQWVRVELANLARRAQVSRSTYLNALLTVASMGVVEPMSGVPEKTILKELSKHPLFVKARDAFLHMEPADKMFKWKASQQTTYERDTATAYGDVAKVSCTELAMENCQKAISLMGKLGLRHEYGAEKLLRDVKLLQIYEGTNQVNMLDYIKRRMTRQFVTSA